MLHSILLKFRKVLIERAFRFVCDGTLSTTINEELVTEIKFLIKTQTFTVNPVNNIAVLCHILLEFRLVKRLRLLNLVTTEYFLRLNENKVKFN